MLHGIPDAARGGGARSLVGRRQVSGALAAGSGVLGAVLGAEAVAISALQPANEKTATAAVKAAIPFLAIPLVLFPLSLSITLGLLICLLLNA